MPVLQKMREKYICMSVLDSKKINFIILQKLD